MLTITVHFVERVIRVDGLLNSKCEVNVYDYDRKELFGDTDPNGKECFHQIWGSGPGAIESQINVFVRGKKIEKVSLSKGVECVVKYYKNATGQPFDQKTWRLKEKA